MKKPIDPNLGNDFENDILIDIGEADNHEFTINDVKPKKAEPQFTVTETVSTDKAVKQPAEKVAKAGTEDALTPMKSSLEEAHHHSSHHHSSGDAHHHSSSGSHHHSSSGLHHHSSSGSHHHHHHHHHHSSKKKLPLPAKIAIGIIGAILIVLVGALITFLVLRAQGAKDLKPQTDNTAYQETIEYKGHTYKFNENVFSVGFLGIDQRTLESVENTDFVGAADTDVVVTVDTKTGKTKVILVPRDTMVDVDIYTKSGVMLRTQQAQLCLAYAYGDGKQKSCESGINAMSRILLNVPIHKYYALDLDGIKPLNDAIGGVTVESLYNFNNMDVKVGDTVTLKGDMAETYIRERRMDKIDASLDRNERQIQYINAYAKQVFPAIVKDFGVVRNLYNTANQYSQTNLTISNVTYMGTLMLSKGVTNFETYTLKGEMKASPDALMPDVVHAEFYPAEDSVMETVLACFYTQID